MDIKTILIGITGLFAVIGAVYIFAKIFISSVERIGFAGYLLGALIAELLAKVVLPSGSIQDTIVARAALITFTVLGVLTVLKWLKIPPYKQSSHA